MLIYVLDDDAALRDIECYALKNSGFEVVGFETAASLVKGIRTNAPDLMVMDVDFPEGGVAVENIRNQSVIKDIPLIVVSEVNCEMMKVKFLDAGADDYLAKPFGVMEFISRVKALLRRCAAGSKAENVIHINGIQMDEKKREVIYQGRSVNLTYKEFELLKYLMVNRGIVLSRDTIMENVWGFDFQGETRTVDMHIKTLRKKLGCTATESEHYEKECVIKTIRNVGYKFG